jgi:hypothetical protein
MNAIEQSDASAILGVFPDADSASDATRALREAGFSGRDYDILSSAPFPEGAFGEEPTRHRLYVFPLVGALCGFAVALLVTVGTQASYPLVTGGKPILAIPPMFIIAYEGTMLGAIIGTVLGVLFESRLPSLGLSIYDTRITEGYIGVLAQGDAAQLATADAIFRANGAADVRHPDDDAAPAD